MTTPAHIAMFSIAAHGHVNPSLEVIRELVARGHRVTYAIPPLFAEKVAETGARPVPYTSVLPSPDADPDAWGTTLLDNVEPFLDDAIQALPQLIEAYEGDSGVGVPDLVLHDIASYPARVLAHRWGVPAISLSPNLVAWDGYEEEVAEPMWAEPRRTERGRAYYARFEAWLAENGITEHPDPFAGRPARSLVLIPRALQPHADRVDERVHSFVGACQGDRAAQGEWERPAGAEKVALVSLGSAFTKQPAFYRECVAAFGELPGWHLVLQIEPGSAFLGPAVGRPEAGRPVRHARRCGRQPGGAGHGHADDRRAAGRGPVRQRGHAPGPRRRPPPSD
jgi:MGT family glycosyltransferase